MAENLRTVSIGELIVSSAPEDVLIAYGLGSCVAVCVYDPVARVGGMLHALLPSASAANQADGTPAKYVDQGVPLLVDSILQHGAQRRRLVVRLAGGAQVLTIPGMDGALDIGKRNVRAAEETLQALGLRIHAQATGGNAGRTVKLYVANGQVTVKSLGQPEQLLE